MGPFGSRSQTWFLTMPCLNCLQVALLRVGMYPQQKWIWAGVGYLFGMYLLSIGLVCAAYSYTPVSL